MPDFSVTVPLGLVDEDAIDELLTAFKDAGAVITQHRGEGSTLSLLVEADDDQAARADAAAAARRAEGMIGRPVAGAPEVEAA